MPTSTSRLSYNDCYEVFDAALAAVKGLRLTFPDEGSARNFTGRLHKARVHDRESNSETYDRGHPMHGQSHYDQLIVRCRENGEGWVVLIEPQNVQFKMEEIE